MSENSEGLTINKKKVNYFCTTEIWNIYTFNLTPVFRPQNIHLKFSTCPNQFKRILCTEKPVLSSKSQDFRCTNLKGYCISNHLICFEKDEKYENYPHTTRISGFKYVFVAFLKQIRWQII